MICDIHVHTADLDCKKTMDSLLDMRKRIFFRLFSRRLSTVIGETVSSFSASRLENPIALLLEKSVNNIAVFLALDRPYDEDGTPLMKKKFLSVSNEYIYDLSEKYRKVLFGASIHPYRKDAVSELEKSIKDGACLVKWLPSAQNIDPASPLCLPFYEILAHHKIPLLSHTGNEHFLTGGPNTLNDPRRLLPALKRGVTVIAAHCGTRMFLHERCFFRHWRDMALEYENFYGDTAAFIIPTRLRYLKRFLDEPALLSKVLYASDIPGPPLTWSCLFKFGYVKTKNIAREKNPFNISYNIFRELGFPDEFFSRSLNILRIPQEKMEVIHG